MDSTVLDLKTFVPAKDYEVSKQFYIELGFTLNWSQSDISEFQAGSFRFLLQKYYVKEWAENFMMHLMVADADVWWEHIRKSGIIEKYPKLKVDPPKMQPWGLRVLYLSDPSGVLWHIADNKKA